MVSFMMDLEVKAEIRSFLPRLLSVTVRIPSIEGFLSDGEKKSLACQRCGKTVGKERESFPREGKDVHKEPGQQSQLRRKLRQVQRLLGPREGSKPVGET